ncbi:MAG: class I SAM-dependent methyltransferase [Burkholderiales bacterium]|nr:class I SAM-dependent methyltransferase [Burkholderiales bacterium]
MPGTGELDYWNARFDVEEYHYGKAPNAFLARQAPLLRPGMRALCVADGEGRNSVWLAEHGLEVTAFDFSPPGVAKARRLAAERGVTVDHRLADIYAWGWDAHAYDLVVAIFIQFAAPRERALIFAGLARALAPDGYLVLQGYTPRQLAYGTGGPPVAENMYTEQLLRDAFRGLDILHLAEHDDIVREGKRHNGMSALIDLVARKSA